MHLMWSMVKIEESVCLLRDAGTSLNPSGSVFHLNPFDCIFYAYMPVSCFNRKVIHFRC